MEKLRHFLIIHHLYHPSLPLPTDLLASDYETTKDRSPLSDIPARLVDHGQPVHPSALPLPPCRQTNYRLLRASDGSPLDPSTSESALFLGSLHLARPSLVTGRLTGAKLSRPEAASLRESISLYARCGGPTHGRGSVDIGPRGGIDCAITARIIWSSRVNLVAVPSGDGLRSFGANANLDTRCRGGFAGRCCDRTTHTGGLVCL